MNFLNRLAVQLMTPSMDSTLSLATVFSTPAHARRVAGERADVGGDFGACSLSVSGHDRGDGAGERTAFVGIIRQAVAHAERTEIRNSEASVRKMWEFSAMCLGGILRVSTRISWA